MFGLPPRCFAHYLDDIKIPQSIIREKPRMTFSAALTYLKAGQKLQRTGWNGQGMYVWMVESHGGDHRAYLEMFTVDKKFVPWVASQTDLLADDWQIYMAPLQAA
jgi:hypothetical protein